MNVTHNLATLRDAKAPATARNAAEDALIAADTGVVFPELIPAMPPWPSGGIWNGGGREVDQKFNAPFKWQTYYAMGRIWDAHIGSPLAAKILNEAVACDPNLLGQPEILRGLLRHKTAETSRLLAAQLSSTQLSPSTKLGIAMELMELDAPTFFRCRPRAHS